MLSDFVSFDVETTGLSPIADRIIELAAVRWRGGHVTGAFHTLVNPGISPHPAAIAVHGISEAEVARAPSIAEALRVFEAFRGALPLAAHNAPFDIGFLTAEGARAQLPQREAWVLDTLALSKAVFPGQPSYKLERLSAALSLQAKEHHRALADAETAGRLAWLASAKAGEPDRQMWSQWKPELPMTLAAS